MHGVSEPTCQSCGCSSDHACEGGCFWVAPGICSRCYLAAYVDIAQEQGPRVLDQAMTEISDTALVIHGLLEAADPLTTAGVTLPRLWRPGDAI